VPPFGDLGVTYTVHLSFVEKRVVDFILVLTELFSRALTVETLWADILVEIVVFERCGSLGAQILVEDDNFGQVVHIHVPLSLSSITWYRPRGGVAAGKVTAGVAKSNGNLPPGGWLIVACGLIACTQGSAPGPKLVTNIGIHRPNIIYHVKQWVWYTRNCVGWDALCTPIAVTDL